MESVFCVGCGETLEPLAVMCPRCDTPAIGAEFEGDVTVTVRGALAVPPVCCCCLGEKQVTQDAKAPMSFSVSVEDVGIRQEHLLVPIPWCRRCRNRDRILFWLTLLTFALGSLLAMYFISDWVSGAMSAPYAFAGMAAGGIMAGIVRMLLKAMLPNRAGHVKNCLAVGLSSATRSADGKETTLQINLRNRAFAKRWLDAQKET